MKTLEDWVGAIAVGGIVALVLVAIFAWLLLT